MKATKTDHYTYRVLWSEEDQEHVALCSELPSLSWLAPTPEGALRGIRKTVAEVVTDMLDNGEKVPEPLASRKFSGKFMVRIPPEVHRHLAIEAAEEKVSLNRLVSAKLAHA
jgi:predicted HicB family RNase H-like nuclease